MPIYEYECLDCRAAVELLIRGAERPKCPECGSSRLEKRLSVPAAHVGGSSRDLPLAPAPGTCGRPQCGAGGCQGLGPL